MYDKTELLNTVSVLKSIPLKPILTLLHSEFYVWKSVITLKLFKGNISFIIYDEWLSNATVSQKFRSSFETNIENKEIYWKSEHVLCYIIGSQYICFFLFSMFHCSSGCFFSNAVITVNYQHSNSSLLPKNEPLKIKINWRSVSFPYLRGKMI